VGGHQVVNKGLARECGDDDNHIIMWWVHPPPHRPLPRPNINFNDFGAVWIKQSNSVRDIIRGVLCSVRYLNFIFSIMKIWQINDLSA
jgi:hypothetical protein